MARVRVRSHMMSMMLPTLMRIMVITLPIVSVMLPTFDPYVTYDAADDDAEYGHYGAHYVHCDTMVRVHVCMRMHVGAATGNMLLVGACCDQGEVHGPRRRSRIWVLHCKAHRIDPPPRPHRATTTNKQRATHMKLIIPGRS